MSNLLLNIDFKKLQPAKTPEGNAQNQKRNKDKYKRSKLKIIQKKNQRREKTTGEQEVVVAKPIVPTPAAIIPIAEVVNSEFNITEAPPVKAPEVKQEAKQISDNSKQISKAKFQQKRQEQFKKREDKKQGQNPKENGNQQSKIEETKEPVIQEAEVFASEKFEDLPINDKLKQILKENNFDQMTNIQKNSIAVILKSQNTIIKSETGSGKTLCYLVPLLEYLSHKSLTEEKIHRDNGTYCIIFSPTRELCVQIEIEMKKLLKLFYYVVCGTITGGENPQKEKSRMKKGLTVIICTPGRFLYHLQNTQCLNLSHLSYLIFDEADRMLDQGFEREVGQCLKLIKKKAIDKFKTPIEVDNYWSDTLKINFVSATLTTKVEALGKKLMESYQTVGFGVDQDDKDDYGLATIPKQIQQFYVEIPVQYKLLYLIAFLYSHQTEKIIVFASNCEHVNFLNHLLSNLNWNKFGERESDDQQQVQPEAEEQKPQILCGGHIYKLHGDMDHNDRKKNYFGFDKAEHSILICTDVASRGLDFKHVEWIIQYDVSSQIKDYVNRVGRTARIASSGSSLTFLMPQELKYVEYMKKSHGIELFKKDRFQLIKLFQAKAFELMKDKKLSFSHLKNIDDRDEQQEAIHKLRSIVRVNMQNESLNLLQMAQVAKNSSTRAYAGHNHEMRHIFEINNLNLTEFARAFGLYKNLQLLQQAQANFAKKNEKKRSLKDRDDQKDNTKNEDQKMYTMRLKKAKQKELEKKLGHAEEGFQRERIMGELKQLKKEVYIDDVKVERRRQNFEKARYSVNKKVLSEFV